MSTSLPGSGRPRPCPNGLSCPGCPHEWAPYTNASLRTVTLCEETGEQVSGDGLCTIHGGDACLYVYRHPYDNGLDRWKKASAWGEQSDESSSSPSAASDGVWYCSCGCDHTNDICLRCGERRPSPNAASEGASDG